MKESVEQMISAESEERPKQGRDELNLAEFPLSAIAERVDKNRKTLTFEDTTWDESRGELVTRQLVITASDEYGLPTAHDDEVILGLINMSKLKNFESRDVHFSRYELLKLLGWSDDSKSYRRLKVSLKRWLGVTLFYKNAWWDREQKSWVDENFHILDNVTLYDREDVARRQSQGALPLSSFSWNKVVFRSFNSGNLKSLDFDLCKSLQSSIAKRLYRFLDKRFYHRSRWEFDLKEVSWEHIGLSRSYDAANLKRKLLPAIEELQKANFLVAVPQEERFLKLKSGVWNVVFEKCTRRKQPGKRQEVAASNSLIDALVARGVTLSTASDTVVNRPADKITSQLEVFDWMMSQPESKRPRNPPGFLIESIKGEYAAPTSFVSKAEAEKRRVDAIERKRKSEARSLAEKQKQEAKEVAKGRVAQGFWDNFSDDERARLEAEAVQAATDIERDLINRGGPLARTMRKHVLDRYAIKVMEMAA